MHSSPFRALAHYRTLPALVGRGPLLVAFLARAPYAMVPLGAMTAFTASTGSVAQGGLATGITSISTAVASPLIGRWADRRGQRFVLMALTPVNAVALALLFLAALLGWTGPLQWGICLAAGATCLPIGSFTRARWVARVPGPRELAAAFSYESMADELVFVLGPALVGIAASVAAPAAPLALAVCLVVVAGIPFALAAPGPDTRPGAPDSPGVPTPGTSPAHPTRPRIGTVLAAVLPSVVVMVCIGSFFGTVQAGTTERAELLGSPGSAGLVYALMGLGSGVMALMVVLVPERITLPARVAAGGLGMGVLITVVSLQSSLGTTALALLATGTFVGPTMVTAFSLAERLAPEGGISVAMTSMQSAVTVGVSLGSSLGGVLAAAHGPEGAFAVGMVVSACICLCGTAMVVARGRRRRSPEPSFPG